MQSLEILLSKLIQLPNPIQDGIDWNPEDINGVDDAEMLLWGGYCGVHTVFTKEQVNWWKNEGWDVLIHPESPLEAVQCADGFGSTAYLWNTVLDAPSGSKFAIGTEGHFVQNLKAQAALNGIEVEHLADAKLGLQQISGCGCATMSRNDPPHLAGMLDLLRKGEAPDANHVLAGDTVDEHTGIRSRLDDKERNQLKAHAKLALERMIEITEAAS